MGYYTKYTLSVSGNINPDLDYEQLVGEHSEYGNTYMFEDSCKWYNHEKDMRSFSKLHPEVLFLLEGEGEESGDLWQEYYQDGKMQRCNAEIIFEQYDKTKMK